MNKPFFPKIHTTPFLEEAAYGRRYRQGRDATRADKTAARDAESASWGRFPESVGECPHLSGARGVGLL